MDDIDEPLARRAIKFLLVTLLHVVVLVLLLQHQIQVSRDGDNIRMDVRMIQDLPSPPKEKPKPLAPKLLPVSPQPVSAPPPILAAAPSSAPSAASFAVPPQPPAPLREIPAAAVIAPPAPLPLPVTAARFDADYLNNPAPAYPAISRRLREEGRVLLLVRVTSQGLAEGVEVRQGSGYSRLDEAALAAVKQWRFVPARRGNVPVAASVLVPIDFRLQN